MEKSALTRPARRSDTELRLRGVVASGLGVLGVLAATGRAEAVAATASTGQPGGAVILDARLRYEFADQSGLPETATAVTARVRAGYQTPQWAGFRALVEAEGVAALIDDYNDTINRRTEFPVVADPEGLELNRAQIEYRGAPETTVTLGRQRIILGDARFVGNVGFRQNEQTFDALRVQSKLLEPVDLDYAYVARTQRIFGPRSPQEDFTGDTHLLTVGGVTPLGQASAYGYWLDLEEAPALSSATYGARLERKPAGGGDWRVGYLLEYARQTDHADAPIAFEVDYARLQGSVGSKSFEAALGGEILSGNGARAFQTPLATLHAFQGFADVFLNTPADGLRDLHAKAGWARKAVGPFATVKATLAAHDFSEDGGERLGREVDANLRATFAKTWAVEVKAAHFEGEDGGPRDLTRVWLALEYKL